MARVSSSGGFSVYVFFLLAQKSLDFFHSILQSQGIPPVKKEGEKKEDTSNNMEGKGIASRIIGPFRPVSTSMGITDWGEAVVSRCPREIP